MSKNLNIAILGAGESGLGAALLGQKLGMGVWVSDAGKIAPARKQELENNKLPFEEGQHTKEAFFEADLIIKSPGIPDKAPIIQELKAAGKKVVSEIEFAYTTNPALRIIAITGSNGKTTTTALIHHILEQAGMSVSVGGNIGNSFARLLTEANKEVYVLEISSFQLDDIDTFQPEIALLLNITPDHLDRYDYKLEQYAAAKFRIAMNQQEADRFIYNMDDAVTTQEMDKHTVKGQKLGFSADAKDTAKAWIEGNMLVLPSGSRFDFGTMHIKGQHNAMNAMAAVLVAKALGLNDEQIQSGLNSFEAIPHRMELVPTSDGKRWINDSKGTNVDAVMYALDAVKEPTVWIAGGIDKGNDYSLLDVSRVKSLIILGPNWQNLKAFFTDKITEIHYAADMPETIKLAESLSEKGDTILLSPACSSFDIFDNYAARGDQFRNQVNLIINDLMIS
ncbi:MAG: UDP-N-acetylmuramoyl-L-alanine--D-glutamate ligase [Bacteroidia bacterium]